MVLSSPSLSPPQQRLEPLRVPLRSELAPEEAVLWLRDDRRPFALVGNWLGTTALLGSEPVRLADPGGDPFDVLDRVPELTSGEVAVGGGWIGWLGYGLGAHIEKLPPSPPAPKPRPPFSLAFYDHVLLFDGEQWWFEALASPERAGALRERISLWEERLARNPTAPPEAPPTPFMLSGNGAEGHVRAVAECRRRIARGDLFQANLAVRLEARFDGDPIDLFARALPLARPRFGALIDGVVSLSPERFLRRSGRRVHTEPIKGTRPRTGGEQERREALEELIASSKDAAEHVMIVDLMRNDLGRVCRYGTITAEPPRAEGHAGVWHLVSTVSGQLRDDVRDGTLLRATFPPGSVTGAPKVEAMKVIATLEGSRREAYTGAIGIVSPIAGLDLSVAIRTFEISRDTIWFGAGGGIVADSDPELELAEAFAKASGPISAINGKLAPARRGRVPHHAAAQSALRYGARPDPAAGVFETLLVEHGVPVDLEAHVERLAASLRECYDSQLDPGVAARARAAASRTGTRSRLRIVAEPDGSAVVTFSPAGNAPAAPAELMAFALPGGLGAHKWRDRRLLEALAAHAAGAVPLLIDTDDLALEAAYANIWIVEQGALVTPPADGRILAGVTRAALLAGERSAREEQIGLARLESAEAIFLTSSISGRHPAVLRTDRE